MATAQQIRDESYAQSERARERAARALADQITLAQQGVTVAQEASDKSLAEMRAQAARGLASQFQAAGPVRECQNKSCSPDPVAMAGRSPALSDVPPAYMTS